MWGVDANGGIQYKETLASKTKTVPGKLKQVEVGQFGVFGVTSKNKVLYRKGTHGNCGSMGSEWQEVEGSLTHISVGVDNVWGVNSNDEVYTMEKVTFSDDEISFSWKRIGGLLKHIKTNGSPLDLTNPTAGTLYYTGILQCHHFKL